MRLRTTFILAGALLGLAALVFVLNQRLPNSEDKWHQVERLASDRAKIHELQILNGDVRIVFSGKGDSWFMIKPVRDRADNGRIEQVLRAVESLHLEAALNDLGRGNRKRNALKDFGLLKPRLTLELKAGKLRRTIEFGNDSALPGQSYARLEGDSVVVAIPSELKTLISNSVDYFRDHRLIPFGSDEVDDLSLSSPNGAIDIQRSQGSWEVRRPIKARASDRAVGQILHTLVVTSILSFQSPNRPGGSVNESSDRRIAIRAGGSQVDLEFGTPESAQSNQIPVKISDRPSPVRVESALTRLLEIKPNDLRDRKIVRLNPDLIDRITIERPGEPKLVLQRHENHWRINPFGWAVDSNRVNSLIRSLNEQDVNAFVSDTATDLARYGLDRPSWHITFSSYASENTAESNAGEEPLVTLLLGRSEAGDTFARIAEEPYIFAVSQTIVGKLSKTIAELSQKR